LEKAHVPTLRSLPDNIMIDCAAGESVLEAARRGHLAIAHACGGKAKCSTCRIWILTGAEGCPPKELLERELTSRLGPTGDIRLACQLRPTGDITFRRLVLDETDLLIANQLHRSAASKTGEVKPVVLFFSDVVGFTSFSETLTPYDVMYLLNRSSRKGMRLSGAWALRLRDYDRPSVRAKWKRRPRDGGSAGESRPKAQHGVEG
jgi:ferredoxin